MIIKIHAFIISFFLLAAALHAPLAGAVSYISTSNSNFSVSRDSGKIINHSSFVQMPRHVFDMCLKVGRALQNNILLSFSGSETVLKNYYKVLTFSALFDCMNLKENRVLKSLSPSFISRHFDDESSRTRGYLIFTMFALSLILLFLLTVKKGNLPYSIINYRNKTTRYQL
jgi:hypothetical protein